MPGGVCPWWMGYCLASPLRRFVHSPAKILDPHVRPGMVVLEPGPGMGHFTLELLRRVRPGGRVVAVDIEPRMLAGLRRRAHAAGLLDGLETREAASGSMGVDDLAGTVDFVLAFAVVHELPSAPAFFAEASASLKPGGRLLLAELVLHVTKTAFDGELMAAGRAGLPVVERPAICQCRAALLERR